MWPYLISWSWKAGSFPIQSAGGKTQLDQELLQALCCDFTLWQTVSWQDYWLHEGKIRFKRESINADHAAATLAFWPQAFSYYMLHTLNCVLLWKLQWMLLGVQKQYWQYMKLDLYSFYIVGRHGHKSQLLLTGTLSQHLLFTVCVVYSNMWLLSTWFYFKSFRSSTWSCTVAPGGISPMPLSP